MKNAPTTKRQRDGDVCTGRACKQECCRKPPANVNFWEDAHLIVHTHHNEVVYNNTAIPTLSHEEQPFIQSHYEYGPEPHVAT